jgi:hypothetical protein
MSSSELIFEVIRTNCKDTVNSEAKKNIHASITKAIRSLIEQQYNQLLVDRKKENKT